MLIKALALAALLAGQQQTPAPASAAKPPQTPAPAPSSAPRPAQQPATGRSSQPAPARRPAAAGTTLEIRVTDRSGTPASGAQVSAVGPTLRDGTTDASGVVVFRTMSAGTYRIRAEHEGLVTLEKELAVRAGTPASADMSLSAAPEPPPPPPAPAPAATPPPAPAPAPAPLTGARGEPKVLSIPDLAERSLSGRDNVKVVPVGCTGLTNARLIVLRESLPSASYNDADESLYLVAGEATLTIESKPQALTAGWFGMLPRDTNFEIVRTGRNPAIFLSLLNGRPCPEQPVEARK
jgi:hypothetical protein